MTQFLSSLSLMKKLEKSFLNMEQNLQTLPSGLNTLQNSQNTKVRSYDPLRQYVPIPKYERPTIWREIIMPVIKKFAKRKPRHIYHQGITNEIGDSRI